MYSKATINQNKKGYTLDNNNTSSVIQFYKKNKLKITKKEQEGILNHSGHIRPASLLISATKEKGSFTKFCIQTDPSFNA